jgi:hypothetical protein
MRFLFALFALSLAVNLAVLAATANFWVIPGALLGWWLADAASGLIHLVMDYWPCRREIGFAEIYFYPGDRSSAHYVALRRDVMARANPLERLIYDFKNHHPRPDALGRRSIAVQIGSTVAIVALPASLLLNLWCWLAPPPSWVLAAGVSLIIGGAFAQYFHGTLHRDDNPLLIRLMRRVGLLMTPAAHQKHHDSLKRDFATNCGWSNPVINPVFRWLYARRLLTDAGLEPSA